MRIFLLSIFVFIFGLSTAQAQESYYCDKLKENKIYSKNSSYKKLIEGRDGWIFRTKTDFVDDFKVNSALKDRFVRLHKAFKDHDMELVVALLPTRGMMHSHLVDYPQYDPQVAIDSYLTLTEKLKEIGISVAAVEDFSQSQDFYYKRDHHWQEAGAKIIAKKVASEVKKLSVYKSIEKKKYKTEETEIIQHEGTFSEFINKICKIDVKPEGVSLYKTFVDGAEDLFGDEGQADIVLIGTSNSAQQASHANFDGFLKEYIGADVQNLSVSGGGVDTAMLDWLSSEGYKGNKPKVVIWEIPVYQNFKGGPFYRQAIAGVYGDCKDGAVLQLSSEIKNDRFEVSLSEKNIDAKNHYVFLKFSDFRGRKFRMTSKYEDGSKDPFNFRRSKFYKPDGVFYMEFDQDSDKKIVSISGSMPSDSSGNVSVSVCRYPDHSGQE